MNGNWKNHYSKRGSAELVNRHGHGVEGTIHWGPDWSDERVGRYRLTNWDGPPLFDYDVVRGPVCVRIRRWGHPILSIGPQVGRPHKVMATVTYSFWAGQPYVIMESKLEVLEDVRFRDCRNDEFVIGEQLPERAWMGPEGEIGFGARGWQREDPRWVTHFNRETGEGFGSIHLEFENTNPSWPQPAHAGFSHTGTWVRYPVQHAAMRAGEHVYERNAYVLHRYEEGGEHGGLADLVSHQQRLLNPITQGEAPPAPRPINLDNVMDALRATNEFELYVEGSPWGQRQLSFVDIGIVRDVAIQGSDIRVDIVMPYAGRETWFDWFSAGIEEQGPRSFAGRRRGRSAPRPRAQMDPAAIERPRPPRHRAQGRVEPLRRHWVAVVGKATGVEPGHDALRVVNRGQRPSRLLRYHLLEKLGTEGAFEIEHVVAYTRQDDAEEALHDIEGVGHTNPRIPLQECLRVAIDRAEEAVEAAERTARVRQLPERIVCPSFDRARSPVWPPVGPYPDQSGA